MKSFRSLATLAFFCATASSAFAQLPPPGGGSEAPPKDNNPANPSNWEKVVSTTGLISAFSYPSLTVNTQDLSVLLAPEITDIQSWMNYSAYWDLPNGVRNFRLKWVGIGPAPASVRVLNKGKLTAHFSGPFDLTQSFTGLDTIWDASTSVDHILQGEDYKNVGVDTLYQIGFKMKGTITGNGTTGRFNHEVSSTLAELSTALRNKDGDTYHRLGDGPNKELNVGEDYTNWVMDCASGYIGADGKYRQLVDLSNILTGPWGPNTTFTYTAPGSLPHLGEIESASGKSVYYELDVAGMANAPAERTVTVSIKDPSAPDAPERTANIKIRIHLPDENWRKVTYSNGTPHESMYDKVPDHIVLEPGYPSVVGPTSNGNIKFKSYFSYPWVKYMSDAISAKQPLLDALSDAGPLKFKMLMKAAQVTREEVLRPEPGDGPHEANYPGQWYNPRSQKFPPEADYNDYSMVASVAYVFKKTTWKADAFDHTGYIGVNGGYTDFYNGPFFVFGIYFKDSSGPPLSVGPHTGNPNVGGNESGSGDGSTPPGGI